MYQNLTCLLKLVEHCKFLLAQKKSLVICEIISTLQKKHIKTEMISWYSGDKVTIVDICKYVHRN